jgi:type IV secretory pathway VirB2 component (pilin)
MTLSIPHSYRRHLPLVLQMALFALAMSAGLHAQTPIESTAQRLTDILVRITPYLATIAFIIGGIFLGIGHHSAHERLANICFGVAIALGAVSLVNYFRP